MTDKIYNFGEKSKEKIKDPETKQWVELEVWQTPKYKQSKEKAIEIIEKGGYGVTEGDFWILMNKGGSKMCYTGLIISHNGVLKINAKLDKEKKFKPECADIYKDEASNIVMRYVSPEQGIYEFGEVSPKNCKNEYPYAMALKRLQDRVVLKTSEIAFFGIYSDAESEDFKENPEEQKTEALPQSKGNKTAAEKFSKQPSGQFAGLAEQAGENIKAAAEEERLSKLKLALDGFSSLTDIDEYLEGKLKGRSRLEVLQTMSPVNAAQAKTIIKNAKLAVDPEYKGE